MRCRFVSNDTTRLVCPDCGCSRLEWTIKQVQQGDYYEFENGNRDAESYHSGEIVSDDVRAPVCTSCDTEHNIDDLVPEDDYDNE